MGKENHTETVTETGTNAERGGREKEFGRESEGNTERKREMHCQGCLDCASRVDLMTCPGDRVSLCCSYLLAFLAPESTVRMHAEQGGPTLMPCSSHSAAFSAAVFCPFV